MASWRGIPPATLRETPRLPPPTQTVVRQPRHEGSLALNYRWPVLVAVTVSPGLAASVLVLGLLGRKSFYDSVTMAGYVLAISFMVLIFVLPIGRLVLISFLEVMGSRPERARSRPQPEAKPYPVPFRTSGGKPPETIQDKMERAFSRIGDRMRKTGDRMASAPPPRSMQRRYAQDTRPVQAKVVEPVPSPETSLMQTIYERTHKMYHRCLTRASFEVAYPGQNGQAIYAECKEWWMALGWVTEDGRGTMSWRFQEHELYKSDRMLERIARQNGFQFPEGGIQ